MKAFEPVQSKMAGLDIPNVDTDQIIPKQFLKRVERTGFGQFLFYDWRFITGTRENPDFSLNKPEAKGSRILLARDNFGCGSSREHAPWALLDYGFQVIIAPSYADIFYNNCFQNGILPIVLPSKKVDALFEMVARNPQNEYLVDLENQVVKLVSGEGDTREFQFDIADEKKEKLIKGLDDIAMTLMFDEKIKHYETTTAVY